jgi:membrane protease YdiL (CAAX protease family)
VSFEPQPHPDAGPGIDAEAGTPSTDQRTAGGDEFYAPTAEPTALAAETTPSPRLSRGLALVEVLLCSGFPTQLFIAQVLASAGMRPLTASGQFSTAFIFTLSLADALLIVGLVVLFLRGRGESPFAVLFGRRPLLPEGVLGLLLVPVVFLLGVIILAVAHLLAPWLHNVVHNPLEPLMSSPGSAALFALVAIISGGVREEVQRAFILHRFEQRLGGAALGLAVSSVLFGAGHVIQGWDAAIATAVFGAFWGAIYLGRRSIGAPLISHAGFDLAMIIRYTLYGL